MRKFQAALCGLLILCGTLAFAAAGDVNSSYVTQENAQASFVALTATGNTATFDVGKALPSNHAVLAVVTGGPATCTISLQGTIDGVTWDTISSAATCTSSVYFYVSGKPVSGIRANLTALTGGASPAVTVFYTGTHGASSVPSGTVTSGTASAITQGGTPMICDSATSGTVTAGQAQMVRCNTAGLLALVSGGGFQGDAISNGNMAGLLAANGGLLALSVAPGVFNGSTWDRQYYCSKVAKLSALAAATTQIVALAASQKIRVCNMSVSNNNATATTLKMVEGTGSNCGTGQADVTSLWNIGATTTTPIFMHWGNDGAIITTTAADALCFTSSAASSLEITITYDQH